MIMTVENTSLKNEYPFFTHNPSCIYLDTAATSQKPRVVIQKVQDILEQKNASVHRGVYPLSQQMTTEFEQTRDCIKSFLDVPQSHEILFTNGATHAFNFLANSLLELLQHNPHKNEIVLSELEHHANIVPWQEFSKKYGFTITYIPLSEDNTISVETAKKYITQKTAIVSVTHLSNVLGSVIDVKSIVAHAQKHSAITIIDGSQSISHIPVSLLEIQSDFYVCSGHKLGALTGCGFIVSKRDILQKIKPFLFGGHMIKTVGKESYTLNDIPYCFEAGTPPIVECISLSQAIRFLQENMNLIFQNESAVLEHTLTSLQAIPDLVVYTTNNQAGIVSFRHKHISSYDIATLLGEKNICVRCGHHCCMPLMKALAVVGTIRVSIGAYTTKKDIDVFVSELQHIITILEKT